MKTRTFYFYFAFVLILGSYIRLNTKPVAITFSYKKKSPVGYLQGITCFVSFRLLR